MNWSNCEAECRTPISDLASCSSPMDERSTKTSRNQSESESIPEQKQLNLTDVAVDGNGSSDVDTRCEKATTADDKSNAREYIQLHFPSDETRRSDDPGESKINEDERVGTLADLMFSIRENVRATMRKDVHMLALHGLVEHGLPESKDDMPPRLECYWQYKEQLATFDSLINLERKLLIPEESRSFVTSILLSKCREANQFRHILSRVFWPEMTRDIGKALQTADGCALMTSRPLVTQVNLLIPTYPFQCVHVEVVCVEEIHFLVVIDRYSKYFSCAPMRSGAIYHIVCALRKHFISFGVCDEMTTGKSQKLAPLFHLFVRNWAVNHHVMVNESSYPYHRCRIDRTLATARTMIGDSVAAHQFDPYTYDAFFQQYSNKPQPNGLCPADCLFRHDDDGKMKQRELALRITDVARVGGHGHDDVTIGAHVQLKRYSPDGDVCWYKTGVVVEVEDLDEETYMVRMDGSNKVRLVRRRDMKMFHPMVSCHPHRSVCVETQLKDDGDDERLPLHCEALCRCWLQES